MPFVFPKVNYSAKYFLSILRYGLVFILLSFYIRPYAQTGINVENIEIVRDKYGVPHIFSDTDPEAIYGIAWAQCEDNFNVLQENYAAVKYRLGKIKGKEGAVMDFICQLFALDAFVESRYEQDISAETEQLLQAYASAINRYAELHPKEVLAKGIFPIDTKDVLEVYIFNYLFVTQALLDVAKVFGNSMDLYETDGHLMERGSNAMAFSPNITKDGKTYLVGNPHQPIEGTNSFWEMSVHSKQGLEFFGATFAGGGLSPFIGCNKYLGWTQTTNFEDYSDIFELTMHPTLKNHYEFDGAWIPLEEKKASLKVKLGFITLPIKKKYYISKYGPTLKNKKGYFAFRSNCFFNLKMVEQYYKMALAKNYDEFWDALNIQALPSQTITYADAEHNIMHISNGLLPKRDENYSWRQLVSGNTSQSLWTYDEKYALDEMPLTLNPNSGYLYNCNNSPLDCTRNIENPKLSDFPKSFGILTTNTHRANRFKTLIKNYEQLGFEDIKAIRDDTKIDKDNMNHRGFMNADCIYKILNEYPEFADVKKVFEQWDGSMDIHNKQAGIMSLVSMHIEMFLKEKKYAYYNNDIPEEIIVGIIRKSKKFLLRYYDTLEVELGKIQKIKRGDTELPMYGAMMTLGNSHYKLYKKGKIKCYWGDTYVMYACFGKNGLEFMKTVNVFGNSNKKEHPHSIDQLEMYVNKQVKNVELDTITIKENASRIYHPR